MELKFLPNLLGRGGGEGRNSATAHAISGSVGASSGMYGSVFTSPTNAWDIDRTITDALERVIWVFRCVDAIAMNASKITMLKREGNPIDGKEIKDPNLKRLLNRRTNRYEDAQMFRYRLSAQLLLSRRGAFIEMVKNDLGQVKQLHLLPPGMVEPIPDPRTFVAGYRLMNQIAMEEVILPKENVVWVRVKPHPTDPYSQMTPLIAAGLAVETDWLSRLFNRNFLTNDGRPGLLIAVAGQMNNADAREMKDRFQGGPEKAGRTTVIEAEGITVSDLAATPRDLQWLEAIRGSKDDILLAFGTPESSLGNASGRTFDNADAEKEGWWEETVQPHMLATGRGLDPITGGDIGDDEFVSYLWDEVEVLQRRKRAREARKMEEFTAGLATIDDYMVATGREPWNRPGTQALILPNGMVIGQDDEIEKAAAALAPAAQAAEGGVHAYGGSPEATQQAALRGAKRGIAAGQRNFENIIAARAHQLSQVNRQVATERTQYWNDNGRGAGRKALPPAIETKDLDVDIIDAEIVEDFHPYDSFRASAEGVFDGVIDTWSGQQAEIVVGRLDHAKTRKYTRHWEGPGSGDREVKSAYVVESDRWADDLHRAMSRSMRRIATDALKQVADEMERQGIVNVMHATGRGNSQGRSAMSRVFGSTKDADEAVSGLLDPLSAVIRSSADKHSKRVAEKIEQLDSSGASMTQIKQEVRSLIGQRSSWRGQMSRYLTTALIEGARHMAYEQAGSKLIDKTWNTVEDERVRHTHEAVNGTTIGLKSKFKVGKYKMSRPGDPAGGPEENAGCRCWLDYSISDEGADLYDEYA